MFSSMFSKAHDDLTFSERKIGQFLIRYYFEEQHLNPIGSEKLASLTECGQSTVIRFSQKLGYATYKSMISELINEAMYADQSTIVKNEPIRESMIKLQKQYNQCIIDVTSQNTDEEVEKCVNFLQHADSILCFGLRSSSAIVSLLYHRLRECGLGAINEDDAYGAVSALNRMKENDVVVIISVSGESPETVEVAKAAKKRHIRVISITGSRANSVFKLSDSALVCNDISIQTKRFNLTNRSSMLYLVDLLFLLLWHNNEQEMLEKANKYYEEVSKFRNNLDRKVQLRF